VPHVVGNTRLPATRAVLGLLLGQEQFGVEGSRSQRQVVFFVAALMRIHDAAMPVQFCNVQCNFSFLDFNCSCLLAGFY